MTNEDDTVRILKRKPLAEIYSVIFEKCDNDSDMSDYEFSEIVESYGYSVAEFFMYERGTWNL